MRHDIGVRPKGVRQFENVRKFALRLYRVRFFYLVFPRNSTRTAGRLVNAKLCCLRGFPKVFSTVSFLSPVHERLGDLSLSSQTRARTDVHSDAENSHEARAIFKILVIVRTQSVWKTNSLLEHDCALWDRGIVPVNREISRWTGMNLSGRTALAENQAKQLTIVCNYELLQYTKKKLFYLRIIFTYLKIMPVFKSFLLLRHSLQIFYRYFDIIVRYFCSFHINTFKTVYKNRYWHIKAIQRLLFWKKMFYVKLSVKDFYR